ncbi:exopolysaccharide biosynthesis protein [Salipiger sp. PrR003]|uniref:exopolysaccharide biosynthesis protein n=1 Tax=Salipiger sp. PrR003 TaxID=2706776 RepID=UPI0013D9AD85|nr:exopolysaccharide biosynthesis protein [Salipiger sp. PrR003]NDV49317.1 exopolysaccharide biosynthesis protein [Salipiger sp. PrR003]
MGRKDCTLAVDPGPEAVPRLVERLRGLAESQDTVTLQSLAKEIGAQGHAPLLLIVATFLILPIGMIPGIGGALGAIRAVIGLQMLLGRTGLWVPPFLGKREIQARRVKAVAHKVRPVADWLRWHLHPRWERLSGGNLSISLIALFLIATGTSLLVLGAIPIAVPLVGIPVTLFAVGLLARDGVIVAAGYAVILLAGIGIWIIGGTQG